MESPAPVGCERAREVRAWIESAVPHMYPDDTASYAGTLVRDGFDSIGMIESELEEEDLAFMKKAHRRALIRARGIGADNGGGSD